jgi:Arc/MetJ family transcription regulator
LRTNIGLDDDLVREAVKLTMVTTMRTLAAMALRELIRKERRKDLFDLAGQTEFAEDFDHKKARALRHDTD